MLVPKQLKLCPTLLRVALHNALSLVACLCTIMAWAAPLTHLTLVHHVELTSSECLHYPCLCLPGHFQWPINSFPCTHSHPSAPVLTCLLDPPRSGSWAVVSSSKKWALLSIWYVWFHTRVHIHTCVHTCMCTLSCLLCCVRCWDYFLWQISLVKSLKMFRGVQPAFCLLQPWDLEQI